MKRHSSSSSGPGLVRIASGIAILPTSCSSAARASTSSSSPAHAQAPAHREHQRADPALVLLQVGVALLEGLQQHVAQLVHGARLARLVLALVEPLVGELHDRGGVADLGGDAHHAVRGADREARALLGERRDGWPHERRRSLAAPLRSSTQNSSPPMR